MIRNDAEFREAVELVQAGALGPPTYPRYLETGTHGSHHGRYRSHQSGSCGPHMVLYA